MPRYAAIDIGSNSVRMLAAEVLPGNQLQPLAQDREVTRLGTSVFSTGRISEQASDTVCAVLRRMAASYHKADVVAVRAVATSAVRDASNQTEFLERAAQALGNPVEIISGQEEARLISLGVLNRWRDLDGCSLIMDVGGGSAEFISLQDGELRKGISRPLGAVRLAEMFLRRDPPSALDLHRMETFIDEKFEPALEALKSARFDRMIGTAATAAAMVSVIHHVPRSERDTVDRMRVSVHQVRKFYQEISGKSLAERRKLPGIGPRRAEIIVSGCATFWRVMEALGTDALYYCAAGVREGIIVDLAQRGIGHSASRLTNAQMRVVETTSRKYAVNQTYTRHVADLSGQLFDALRPLHKLPSQAGQLLQAAAWLHDVGHFISDTGHHKHSAYVVANSDLPGFTDKERLVIAMLCRYHRKSTPQNRHEPYRALDSDTRKLISLMMPILRLAIALDTAKEQKIERIESRNSPGGATLILHSTHEDIDIELWAAERAADVFRQVYGVPMTFERAMVPA